MRSPQLTKSLCHLLDSAGYYTIGWDVEWRFRGASATPVQSAAEMLREVDEVAYHNEDFTKNHIVILAHDRMFAQQRYVDSLNKFITLLKQDPRNVFETIDHYPGIAKN